MSTLSLLFVIIFLFSSNNNDQFSIQAASVAGIRLRTQVNAVANKPGQFLASFLVGSPPQEVLLNVDTGSPLVWMNCKYNCPSCETKPHSGRVFDANVSPSFKPSPCNYRCENQCSPNALCFKRIGYADNSAATGPLATEAVTVKLDDGQEMKLNDVPIMCSLSSTNLGAADGVLGLQTAGSFVSKALEKFERKFSYCWTDIMNPNNNPQTYLIFGNSSTAPPLANMQYTRLETSQNLYTTSIIGVSLNGVMLNVPSDAWLYKSGSDSGFMFDTGATLTYLKKPAYDTLVSALKAPLSKFEKVKSKFEEFQECFNANGFDESLVPKLAFHFKDGAKFEPPIKNYVVEVERGIRCLGFGVNPRPLNIMGNILQQGYHWEYNLATQKLGFAPSTLCVG